MKQEPNPAIYLYMTSKKSEIPSVSDIITEEAFWSIRLADYDCIIEQLVGDYMEAQELLFKGDSNGRNPTKK